MFSESVQVYISFIDTVFRCNYNVFGSLSSMTIGNILIFNMLEGVRSCFFVLYYLLLIPAVLSTAWIYFYPPR